MLLMLNPIIHDVPTVPNRLLQLPQLLPNLRPPQNNVREPLIIAIWFYKTNRSVVTRFRLLELLCLDM
jgi:hypothetical protein